VAVGLIFPWAGATAATAFAGGEISMDQMIRIGIAATVVLIGITTTIHLMMAGVI
jgi:di/tricarboxylate transporter